MGYTGSSTILGAMSEGGKTLAVTQLYTVLSEVLGLLPVVIPVVIGFIAIRKGLAFLFQSMRKA